MKTNAEILKEVLDYFDIVEHQAEVVEFRNTGSLKSCIEKAITLTQESERKDFLKLIDEIPDDELYGMNFWTIKRLKKELKQKISFLEGGEK